MKPQKYYPVSTQFYDNGKVVAERLPAEMHCVMPEPVFLELPDHDLYVDYFVSASDAEAFAKESKHA